MKNTQMINFLKEKNYKELIEHINNLSEDEKIDLLRNTEFINNIPSQVLSNMLNNMNFISVFNMLQNKLIFAKANDLNIKFSPKDNIFFKDLLSNNDIIKKLNHTMLKNMLLNLKKDEVINYLSEYSINNKLTNDDIIDITTTKKIDIAKELNIIERFNKEELIKYINNYWKNSLNYNLLDNDYTKKTIFKYIDINFEEVIYLYDYLSTKNNQNIKDTTNNFYSFNACLVLNEIFGVKKAIELINNNKFDLDDITFAFKDANINNITITPELKEFIIMNIKDYVNKNDNNVEFSFGTIINNYDIKYSNLTYNDITNLLNAKRKNKSYTR